VAAQAAADLAPGGGQLRRLDPEFLFAPRADRVHCCGRWALLRRLRRRRFSWPPG